MRTAEPLEHPIVTPHVMAKAGDIFANQSQGKTKLWVLSSVIVGFLPGHLGLLDHLILRQLTQSFPIIAWLPQQLEVALGGSVGKLLPGENASTAACHLPNIPGRTTQKPSNNTSA